MTGFESVVGINPWTALFTFCNMIITFLLLKKFFFKPLKKMIDDRQKEIDTMYEEAGKAKENAAVAQAQYEEKLRDARTEASAIVSQAAQDARAKGEAIVQEARSEAAALKERAQQDIALERKKAVNGMKDELAGIAVSIASKVTEKEISEKEHTALIEDFIRQLGDGA